MSGTCLLTLMNLSIFGATGPTGRVLVQQALDAGHTVTVYVRNPSKMVIEHPKLRTIAGELTDGDGVLQAVKGSDAVVSLLGPNDSSLKVQGTPIAEGTARIVDAMMQQGVKRLVTTSSAAFGAPGDAPSWGRTALNGLIRTGMRTFASGPYSEISATSEVIRGSDLDWTLVRVGFLTDAAENKSPTVGLFGTQGLGSSVSRATVAAFLLRELQDGKWVRSSPVVSG
uniref:NAD(P)-binding domain-containing protein n=1 Tax=Hemiselmis tepida TaxID=464990 RepID=A0A7S0W9J3_9CRYP|mmetsp:Transcript_6619/g.16933  ORF Transcript_6619/g.16933 Transcript_6619/m.16933 type:complete len:227 (+) Transcript_6619:119-799(+)